MRKKSFDSPDIRLCEKEEKMILTNWSWMRRKGRHKKRQEKSIFRDRWRERDREKQTLTSLLTVLGITGLSCLISKSHDNNLSFTVFFYLLYIWENQRARSECYEVIELMTDYKKRVNVFL